MSTKDFNRALAIDPKFVNPLANRADRLRLQGHYAEAMADCNSAVAVNPFCAWAWTVRGWTLENQGDYKKALENFRQALHYNPDNADLHFHCAYPFFKQEQWAPAFVEYTLAIKYNNNYAAAYYMRGYTCERWGRVLEGQSDYKQALKLNSKAYSAKLKTRHTQYLLIENNTNETVRVYLQYEYQAADGSWVWWPDTPGGAQFREWNIPAHATYYLVDEGWKVRARRARVWFRGLSTGQTLSAFRNKDLVLSPKEGYRAHGTASYLYELHAKK